METLLNKLEEAQNMRGILRVNQIDCPLTREEIETLISLLKGGEWIPLRHEKDEIQDGIDVWLLRPDGEVVFSAKDDFIPLRTFTHYCIAKKPQPPINRRTF